MFFLLFSEDEFTFSDLLLLFGTLKIFCPFFHPEKQLKKIKKNCKMIGNPYYCELYFVPRISSFNFLSRLLFLCFTVYLQLLYL